MGNGGGASSPLPPVPVAEGEILGKLDSILVATKRAEEALVVILRKVQEAEALLARIRPYAEEAERRFGPMLSATGGAAPQKKGFIAKLFE